MIGRVRFIVYDKNAGLSCQNLQQEVYIMEKAKVYYTDFRAKLGEGLPTKLKQRQQANRQQSLQKTGAKKQLM